MNTVRLLPVVMVAASALFLFKVLGIVSGEGYSLSGAQAVSAQEAPADPPQDAEVQDDMARQTGNTLADNTSKDPNDLAPTDALPVTIKKMVKLSG